MNLPIIIGGTLAVYLILSKDKSTSVTKKPTESNSKTTKGFIGKTVGFNSELDKKIKIGEKGYVYSDCDLEIHDTDKARRYAYKQGSLFKESDWKAKIFDGCDYVNSRFDPETYFHTYELYRYAISGAVASEKMFNQPGFKKIIGFKQSIKNKGYDVNSYNTSLIKF